MSLRQSTLSNCIWLFAFIILLGAQCEGDDGIFEPILDYNLSIGLSPEQVEYSIGDTISLSVVLNNNTAPLRSACSGIPLENAEIPFLLYLGSGDTDTPNPPSTSPIFDVLTSSDPDSLPINVSHGMVYSSVYFTLGCELSDTDVAIELKAIARKAGIYKFELRDAVNLFFGSAQDCGKETLTNTEGILAYKFDVTDSHVALLNELTASTNNLLEIRVQGKTINKGIYWLKIVE